MTQRVFFHQIWNRKFVFHCLLMRANVKVDYVHWMNIWLAVWVLMCSQKLSKVMLSSTCWSAEKHTFRCLLCGFSSVFLRKVPCMAIGTTRQRILLLACFKTTGVLLIIRFSKSWPLLTVNVWLTGTLPLMKFRNFIEPIFERLCARYV